MAMTKRIETTTYRQVPGIRRHTEIAWGHDGRKARKEQSERTGTRNGPNAQPIDVLDNLIFKVTRT